MDIETSFIYTQLSVFGVWNWFILAGVLLALELFAPGSVFLWFGLAASATGLLSFFVEMSWQAQFLWFGIFSVAGLIAWRRFFATKLTSEDDATLNSRAASHIGSIFKLHEPIVNGHGRLKIDDSIWRIEGPDVEAGTSVRVKNVSTSTLIVEAESARR